MGLMAGGIAFLIIGILMISTGAVWYMLTLDRITHNECGEENAKTTFENGVKVTTWQGCGNPTEGGIVFIAGLGVIAAGVVCIAKSRRSVAMEKT